MLTHALDGRLQDREQLASQCTGKAQGGQGNGLAPVFLECRAQQSIVRKREGRVAVTGSTD